MMIAKQNQKVMDIFSAVDRLAREDRLATATTALISNYAKVSEGVMFRHFPSKEAIFESWFAFRAGRLSVALAGMSSGRAGLMRFVADLIRSGEELSLLCCQVVDCMPLRERFAELRADTYAALVQHISKMSTKPANIKAETLADALWQAMYRAWKAPDGSEAQALLDRLPWEAETASSSVFPPADVLGRLAISGSGFVFDPVIGNSFTVNETGIVVLRMLQDGVTTLPEVIACLSREFDASAEVLERDVLDFAACLREVLR